MDGGPKPTGFVASRVSTTRHGGVQTKRNPAVDCDTVILTFPEIVGVNKSLAASPISPRLTSEAEKVPTPLISVASPGKRGHRIRAGEVHRIGVRGNCLVIGIQGRHRELKGYRVLQPGEFTVMGLL